MASSGSNRHNPLRVGLTGGIGSGKSTVADLFAAFGVSIIDADLIARELVEPERPAYREIVAQFGPGILNPDGSLNRARLRERVFADTPARVRLEAILHPRIRSIMEQRAQLTRGPYTVLVAPLLLENGLHDMVDRVLVVDATEAVQIARVRSRSGLSEREIRAIMATQMARNERRSRAHDVIDNDGDRETLSKAVAALHQRYLTLAGAQFRNDIPR